MLQYWYELRARLLQCLGCYAVSWLLCVIQYQSIFNFFTGVWGPVAHQLVVSDVSAGLMLPWHFASWLALWLTIPVVLYHVLVFVAPALYAHEQKIVYAVALASWLLFVLGAVFGLYEVVPLVLLFTKEWIPMGVLFLPNVSTLWILTVHICLLFGLMAQTPLILLFLLHQEWLTPVQVRQSRSYWVPGLFFMAMVLTPPDVLSQLAMALPLWLLIELTVFGYMLWVRKRDKSLIVS
ncbi:twin-arginine translocase subunit TatC [Candidatus Comchoanobacter bicostacola]|uniref:Twin-arginine translocase subunit TatC n=1 Tax=Candidatus Comchoanobacter bicostacola TaxID=2919598 RepID=A0ABY5DKF5_9GAMM|nr:twin-arginine translocase subunit TatC [Candidatus Comchoanobacter bicostacola]UTC24467.1 twin-arginine translocase subunit TatC [Candidatus Comchoanobacter bicostacola]